MAPVAGIGPGEQLRRRLSAWRPYCRDVTRQRTWKTGPRHELSAPLIVHSDTSAGCAFSLLAEVSVAIGCRPVLPTKSTDSCE